MRRCLAAIAKENADRARQVKSSCSAWTQIREDFEQIQVNNNSLLTARSYGGNPDPKLIEKTSAEINKRATRLNSNMMLPAGGANEKRTPVQEDNLQMKTLLAALDGLIVRFVTNPIFKDTNVVDVQFSSKAKHDLERIIELSDRVRKKAHKMGEKL